MKDDITSAPTRTVLRNVTMLTSEGWQAMESVTIENGRIQALNEMPTQTVQTRVIDCQQAYLLPGIIDVHGDAFERHITPRAGTEFPLSLAIAANDNSLIGAGITTFFYSITDGFEPGPRSRETVRSLLKEIEHLRPRLSCNSYVHIRHENVNTENHDELLEWLRTRRIDLLSLNNHLPPPDDQKKVDRYMAGLKRRVDMTLEESMAFLASLQDRRDLGAEQTRELVAAAHQAGVPLASHDDATAEDVALSRERGVTIAEFPMTDDCARASQEMGSAVVMGAPNLIRGGSHVGGMSVKDAVERKLVDILCSDYHYPSLYRAPFLLAEMGLLPLEQAWHLVSRNPAKAAGLGERKGTLAPGYDADLLLLESLDGSPLSIRMVMCEGNIVLERAFHAPADSAQTSRSERQVESSPA